MRLPTRPLSALFALWLALVLGDPGVLHGCPSHGGLHDGAPSAAHQGHARSHTPRQTSSSSEHAPEHQGSAPECTCVGQCCAGTAVVGLPPHPALTLVVEISPSGDAPSTAAAPELPTAADHRLPFANGPPVI